MRIERYVLRILVLLLILNVAKLPLQAQTDTARGQVIDSFLLRQKGLIGDLAKNLMTDEPQDTITGLQRNDIKFQRYKGRIIRKIRVQGLDFGISISDTSKSFKSGLTRLANNLHRDTRGYVIRKNLFFRENQKVHPFLLADSERHLRDQEFLQDAIIVVVPVRGSRDSVDIIVRTKDVFSIGGSLHIHNMKSATIEFKEDNLAGMGDRIRLGTLYDYERREHFGLGAEYVARNIGGSFIDGYFGVMNFNDAFNSGNEEEIIRYIRFIRPLVNPYMQWTYALELSRHENTNMYSTDSLYEIDWKYKFYVIDAWAGLNLSADKLTGKSYEDRLRKLISMRTIHRRFGEVPGKYEGTYNWEYADLTALLGSVSIFKQDYYKTQYIYGFGRNEDVPEGIDISLTGGWTRKADRERPYVGLDFQRYYFTSKEHYFNYTARVGTFFHEKKFQDLDMLINLDYFSRLHFLGKRWKNRLFFGAGAAKQVNKSLNQPLFLKNSFGLSEFDNGEVPGDTRIAVRSESVFFSPWNFINFRFAPFIFANAALFTLEGDRFSNSKWISSIGAGIRTRNEALIFGTLELKGYYFPRKNFANESFRVEFNTNVRFRYNRQFIKRPEFVQVN